MAKLLCKVIQNSRGTQLPWAPFGAKDRICTQLIFIKHIISCTIMTNHLKGGEGLHHKRSIVDGSRRGSTIISHLRLRLLNTFAPLSILNYTFSENAIRVSSPNLVSFPKKFLSQGPKSADKQENVGVRSERSSGKFVPFKEFSNYCNRKKVSAASSKMGDSNSSLSASIDMGTVTSVEHLVGDGKKNEKLGLSASTSFGSSKNKGSKGKGKKKRQSRNKINREQRFGAIASDEAPAAKGSKTPLRALILNNTESGKSLIQASDVSNYLIYSQGQKKLQKLYPPTGKSIVIVESLRKASIIQGYLGDMYEVLPTYGHVRDLAARSGAVRPDDNFSMVWEVPSFAWTHLKSIKIALSGAENLILASDPDREGEAIAWHIVEMLQQQDALHKDITIARVVFHEITEASIKKSLQAPRKLDENLVHSYLARRALDYLIGFNISPLLWSKLPGCQPAGRVQSAALSLICDREMEIDTFKPQVYWTIDVKFCKREPSSLMQGRSFSSYLTHSNSKKLNQFSISSGTEAKDTEQKIKSAKFQVVSSKRSEIRTSPPSIYNNNTSTGCCKQITFHSSIYNGAQNLYEGISLSDGKAAGLITYYKTDGPHISDEAVKDIHSLAIERYGMDFASERVRTYFKKMKNAQEAHEAIRPTDIRRLPSKLVAMLDKDSLRLYTLIWSRTIASQMQPASIDQIQLDIGNCRKFIVLRSACSRVEFPGYQAAFEDMEASTIRYKENEGNDHDENFEILKSLKPGDSLCLGEVDLKQHHTQPPPRYSEGSLVKKLEELGIGRPSTYAPTLKLLKDRNYVTVKSNTLYPEFRGRMVSEFLAHHFTEVTDYSFTADTETELDNVSAGRTEWKGLLRDFWTRFSSYCNRVKSVHIHQVEKMLEKKFGDFLFASLPNKSRTCPSCIDGKLIFKVSRFGAGYFIGCDQDPKCKYIAKTLYGNDNEEITPPKNCSIEEPKVLGLKPNSNEKILLKNGPYGFYVQLGEDRKGYSPKRASLSQIKDVDSITLENALDLLRYPITLGDHPTEGGPVILKLARNGFSINHKSAIAPVPKNLKPSDITLEKALELLLGKNVKRLGRPKNKPKIEEAW